MNLKSYLPKDSINIGASVNLTVNSKLPKGNYSRGFLKFFDWLLEYCEKHNKGIDIRDSTYVVSNGRCGGYCDGEKIVIAGKSEYFQEVSVHESQHLVQSVENSPLWTDEDWWSGKFDALHFEKIYNLLLLERDCELRSVKVAEKWDILDTKEYKKNANAYLLSYHYMFLNKSWVMKDGIYDPLIINSVPYEIVSEFALKNIDMDMMAIYSRALR